VGAERPAVGLAPGIGNLFRYVPLVGSYQLLLSTAGLGGGVWRLRVDLGDGVFAHGADSAAVRVQFAKSG